jgi:hypothetical protein
MLIQTTADWVVKAHRKLDLISANLRTQCLNKTVREIVQTLIHEPEMFIFKADPIKLSIETAVYSHAKGGLECVALPSQGQGFNNGGGRIRAFCLAAEQSDSVDLSKIPVFLHIAYGLSDEKQVDVCVASNTSTNVGAASILNKRGIFDPIKERWGDKLPWCVYHEGQHTAELGEAHSFSASASVLLLTQLLLSVSSTYNYELGKHPVSLTGSGGFLSVPKLAEAGIKHRLHLLGDLYDIWFYGMEATKAYVDRYGWVSQETNRPFFPSTKKSPTKTTHFMHTPLKWPGFINKNIPIPVVAACRVFLRDNDWCVTRSWLTKVAVPALWKQYQISLVKSAKVQGYTNIRAALSHESVWSSLVIKAQSLLNEYNEQKRSA